MTDAASSTAIIIGAGHAGGELAIALRNEGWEGRILLLGEEAHLPYHRPPLSKAYLAGSVEKSSLSIRPQMAYDKANVEFIGGVRVSRIDRANQRLELADGSQLAYDRLAIATGGRPRPLSVPNAAVAERCANFHYLRSLDDVEQIRAQLAPGKRLAIVGGGYIGLEVAASAIAQGLQVTVLEALPRVLQRVTAAELSAYYERKHREAGVDIRTGVQVADLEVTGDTVTAVLCADGSRLEADLVVVGIGLLANTELAAEAGLQVDNGILVDEHAQTSDPHIYAAGDCTNHPNALLGRRLRLESVPNALEQSRVAAANMAGKAKTYASVPWFWSDQYELKLKMVGLAEGFERLVLRGDPATDSFSAFYLKGDKVLAADTVNRPQDFIAAKRLVAEGIAVTAEQLADDGRPLKELLPAAQG
ncbi:NAD(P)/FAD-dependent oxidoreductase [Aquipseudomonas alcaligenes]|uniref:Ferredoxin reductase n=1 Tax=Aquipseudomonas alcaligenes TaxID=43263 RepID=A0AA37FK63_AQUAC|nr:FAD-dependent oxidoreductase [Pseudomonas alcaligenes]BCR23733.1 ferredoxin reductase [Pseudomonas alcaligenes]GIZ65184.1 ferredoxin reductase [Pseudomonas alcaligenes]GIZ69491.1 ferredoxin reductase [Pseudomonas alcaligenes]GIZ73843.1 ferredoxin reductase [Pseudomonas alcaligenes]GIZ78204.1 ferredoxin reductase [Pseudomonas alcaligenes]